MKKLIAVLLLSIAPGLALAAGGHGPAPLASHIDRTDKPAIQRGARLFVNYCLSCHSVKYMRYNRMADDLGLTERQLRDNLMFAGEKPGDLMTVRMHDEDAEDWFGTSPPDLSLVTRYKSPDWLYSYLVSFYQDDSKVWGVNNLYFPNVGMPHVLWELQGVQVAEYEEHTTASGKTEKVVSKLVLQSPGMMDEAEFHKAMRDLTTFMAYVGEPASLERQKIGVWVLVFLAVLFVVSFALKKEYWKDVH